ncbi:MAG: phosphoribosylformimino-5-aminoimidazole carboxamide ribotide isomerase [Clostridia bacterium]|nr:phosphoribosylformimino-5-aminoimidazole carboxamide ribotide isomerase [Clostridia bacterium]
MLFRPCIDLHNGKVKQIVGSTLETDSLKENFVAQAPPSRYAELFKSLGLRGGHVIMLGKGNEEAALEALRAYPGGMSVGGGINEENADLFLKNGASQVIVTSALFENDRFSFSRARALSEAIGRDRLIFDLSCVSSEKGCLIACNRWRTVTDTEVTPGLLKSLEPYCCEFLVHAVSSEGKKAGPDVSVVSVLAEYASDDSALPVTYAGGLGTKEDIDEFLLITKNKVYFTIGSALDIYGGNLPLNDLASI